MGINYTLLSTFAAWNHVDPKVGHGGQEKALQKAELGRDKNKVDKLSHTQLCSYQACQQTGRHEGCKVWVRSPVLARTAALPLGSVSSLIFHSCNIHLRNVLCLPKPPIPQSKMAVGNAYFLPRWWTVNSSWL